MAAIAFAWLYATGTALSKSEVDSYSAWRTSAAQVLAARGDANSLATAAALTYLRPGPRSNADTGRAAAALELAVRASERAPDSAPISWLRLQLCTSVPGCDVRRAATTVRWLAADNGAAWLPTLSVAQRDKDTMEIDRVLASMAEGTRFDLYANRTAVAMYSALRRVRAQLPPRYLKSDAARLSEAIGIANAVVLPSFSPLINACRDWAPNTERREACLQLARTMQHADVVMAQLVGFAIEKRLSTADTKELRALAERRRILEWRVAAANQTDPTLPARVLESRARSRLAKMRTLPREEDVSIALLKENRMALEPPEDVR